MIALQAMTPDKLAAALGLPVADARKAVSLVHRDRPVGGPEVGRASRERILSRATVPTLEVVSETRSALDPFVKLAFRLEDGHVVEAVRIPLEKQGRFSVCVSSQAGCALACGFCATGRLGLLRNLDTWEIVEQVRAVRRTLEPGERIRGVVFQGMGEPMANLERVLDAIQVLRDPSALAIDTRAMTVSTAGLPSGILRLAREAPRVRLAVSIGSARPEVRRRIMPIDRTHPLREVLSAGEQHALVTGLAPMWAVTLLSGVNDTAEDGSALARLARDFAERTGKRPRISVIPYNSMGGADPFERASEAAEAGFREALRDGGFGSHKRYSGGADVGAGCGQLAGPGGSSFRSWRRAHGGRSP